MLDDRDEPRGVVGPQDAPRRRILAAREPWMVGLDEHDPLGGDAGQHLAGLTDARCHHDPVRPVLDERRQCSLLALAVVQAGHDEDRVSLAGRGLLEARRDLAVDRIGEIAHEESEDVRPLGPEAPRRGIRDVAEFPGGLVDGRTRRLTDPGIVLQGARRRRLGRPGDPGDVGKNDTAFGGSTHPARLGRRRRLGDRHLERLGPLPGCCWVRTH